MPEKNPRYFLKDKEAKAVLNRASRKLKTDLKQILAGKPTLEVVKMGTADIFLLNGRPLLAEAKGNLCPTLVFAELLSVMPRVVVDMGAIPHICGGADVMAPGIKEFHGDFDEGDLVVVVDEKHCKAVAIGEALFNREKALEVNQGTVIKTIHFVGDKIWDRAREFEAKPKSNT